MAEDEVYINRPDVSEAWERIGEGGLNGDVGEKDSGISGKRFRVLT